MAPDAIQEKLLLVDKDRNLLDLLAIMFRHEGYEPACCANGQRALAAVVEQNLTLVLADAGLPDMRGQRFLADLKRAARSTRVAMMSLDPYDRRQFELIGALQFLPKPLTRQQLAAALAAVRQDRRTTPRLALRVPLAINGRGAGMSTNLSSDGVLFVGPAQLAAGQAVDLSFQGPDNAALFSTPGEVVRSDRLNGDYRTAVFFRENIGYLLLEHIDYFEGLLYRTNSPHPDTAGPH